MGRNLSPILQRELANLDKDADSRESAMKALKSYVKDLDLKTIRLFLAQISETKEIVSLSGKFIISLYEDVARVHGVKIVPMIDIIMASIVQTLASSAGSFPLHQACSKVVPAIARYGIDPTTPEDKKRHIIHSICKPLSDSLLSSQESLTSGAALCLKALVDSDNWRFASDEIVNQVCQNVTVALEGKSTQKNLHVDLVMALAKCNSLIVEAYARLLIHSGLKILNAGLLEGNSQNRLSSIKMMNFLMKCLEPRSIFSELQTIIEEMEKCQHDQMAYVKGAAYEALQTAKRLAVDKRLKYEKSPASVIGSDLSRRDHMEEENISGSGDYSSASISPESRTLDFFPGYDYQSIVESPVSQVSQNLNYRHRSANRKPWSQENGGIDVSLENGLFSEVGQGSAISSLLPEHSGNCELSNRGGDATEEFAGFMNRNPRHGVSNNTTSSPLRSRSQLNADGIKIFETPRKLIHSFQDQNDEISDCSGQQNRRSRNLSSGNIEWSPTSNCDQNGFRHHRSRSPLNVDGIKILKTPRKLVHSFQDLNDDSSDCSGQQNRRSRNLSSSNIEWSPTSNGFQHHVSSGYDKNESFYNDVQFQGGLESVYSTDDFPAEAHLQMTPEVVPENRTDAQIVRMEKAHQKIKYKFVFVCGLSFVLLAIATPLLWINHQEGHYLVPT